MNLDFFQDLSLDNFIQSFFDQSEDLFAFAKDCDFRFTMVNRPLLKSLNLSSESEVLGKTDYDFFSPGQADLFRLEDREVFNTEKMVLNRTWGIANPKGGMNWYISSKYPLRNKSGELKGLIGIMRNSSKVGSYLEPYAELSPIFNFIRSNIARQIEVDELAKIMCLSLSQFERKFKKMMAITPLKFINKMRIDYACERLIKSHDTLSNIAFDCGFFDHSHFSKIFKRIKGMNPSDYRKKYHD
ncbi:AraC family transcriptional regulator [Lentisphaera profundi]|uniref:AraC family transcriptional regulator n=1 Tax=Lentisphaera profundi TaxID=1658616 RepID=A0ABY7VX92_9BACT|nr:AraC family transcriptional regulator [Lentisphaera profundi]WDE97344.1 AraC family transcriptional regulator [Lentisphaera profundi]